MALQVAQPFGPPGGGRRGVGEPLGEGPPRTGRREAAEPARLDTQQHLAPLPGQVTKPAVVPTVNVRGWRGAGRAGGAGLTRRDDDGETVGRRQDLLNQQPCRSKWRDVLEQEPGFGGNRDTPCAHSVPERPPAARGMRKNPKTGQSCWRKSGAAACLLGAFQLAFRRPSAVLGPQTSRSESRCGLREPQPAGEAIPQAVPFNVSRPGLGAGCALPGSAHPAA